MRILKPNEIGKGILIEMDAGYVSPTETRNSEIIKESKDMLDHSKPFEFYAVLQKYNTPNRNGRIYPEKILKRESENYTEVWWEGNVLMGKLKLLTSPGFHERGIVSTKGDMAANYLRQGVTLGISSRGVGSLKKVGEQNEVQDDFELICFDLVSSPSTPGAYLFSNPNEKDLYDENLDEEKQMRIERQVGESGNKSLDLMKKLSDYLGY
jgi:hypothetical protein